MPPTEHSAAWPLVVALVAAIDADAMLGAAIVAFRPAGATAGPRVYNGLVSPLPDGSPRPKPYITIGDVSEEDAHVFGQRGALTPITGHIWADRPDHALLLFNHLKRLLNLKPLAVDGVGFLRGTIRLIGTVRDPGGATVHSPFEYVGLTRVAA